MSKDSSRPLWQKNSSLDPSDSGFPVDGLHAFLAGEDDLRNKEKSHPLLTGEEADLGFELADKGRSFFLFLASALFCQRNSELPRPFLT